MSFSQQRLSSEELRKKAILEIEEPGYVQELEGVSEADKNRIMIRVNQIRGDRERASRILAMKCTLITMTVRHYIISQQATLSNSLYWTNDF